MQPNSLAVIVFILFSNIWVHGQNVYKTPSGKKYHLGTCRMVENVSIKVSPESIRYFDLTPCKICMPPVIDQLVLSIKEIDKAVGVKNNSQQCKGITKKGERCKHFTRLSNGYCYQHVAQCE